jgi:hypothetical protein
MKKVGKIKKKKRGPWDNEEFSAGEEELLETERGQAPSN